MFNKKKKNSCIFKIQFCLYTNLEYSALKELRTVVTRGRLLERVQDEFVVRATTPGRLQVVAGKLNVKLDQ